MNEYRHILQELGFALDEKQPHMSGERRVFASHKLVLFGARRDDRVRVVIKAANTAEGVEEIKRERICREALNSIRFAYGTFASPEELLFTEKDGYTIQVTRFIEQERPFLERATPEQFHFALKGLKAMETAHASTYEHQRSVRGIFPTMTAEDYLYAYVRYVERISGSPHVDIDLMERAGRELSNNKDSIERYCGFLTHYDYMPQNFRISGESMYLLDHSSLRFGNKHESWARFIHFMLLYNTELANALLKYMHDNRAPEEIASLRLMRIFRLAELLAHHARVEAEASDDSLRKLSGKRVIFWSKVLESVAKDSPVEEGIITQYKVVRDALRSPEEKERQKGLH